MAIGPGKYDKLATLIRHRARATGVIVIVFGGEHGDGFSAQLPLDHTMSLPQILRSVADTIDRDGPFAPPA